MEETFQSEGHDFLAHYGVKGMQWGVRRKRGSDGRVSGTSGAKPKVKSAKDLSDEELKSVVNRMNLEAQYSRLNPQKQTLGKRLMTEGSKIAADVARQQVKNTANAFLAKEIQKATGLNAPKKEETDKN